MRNVTDTVENFNYFGYIITNTTICNLELEKPRNIEQFQSIVFSFQFKRNFGNEIGRHIDDKFRLVL